jgi:hypothetical protein
MGQAAKSPISQPNAFGQVHCVRPPRSKEQTSGRAMLPRRLKESPKVCYSRFDQNDTRNTPNGQQAHR